MNLLGNQVFTVTEITSLIKEILENGFREITIEGEISDYTKSSSGHIYFKLNDSKAQIRAVMFKSAAYNLKISPKNGDIVKCKGNLSVYANQGNYQLIINSIEYAGEGNLLKMLELRKQKLAQEGLFDSNKKKPLPPFPNTIGVVTSPSGAAIQDILRVAKSKNKNINIIIFPSLVQGENAAESLIKMIEIADYYKLCDILIIGRGGGSIEDLLPFSDENLVRTIANAKTPTISAVGHDIDWALSDYAADVRALTPTAAADIAIPRRSEIKEKISSFQETLSENLQNKVEGMRLLIKSFNPDMLEIRFRSIQQPLLSRFENAKANLEMQLNKKIEDYRIKIQNSKNILENTSPNAIFARGYSMVKNNKGEIIRSSQQVSKGEIIEITPSIGKITAEVGDIIWKILKKT